MSGDSKTEIFIDAGFREVRVATLRDGQLSDLVIEPGARQSVEGNIYLGRVVQVAAQLQAAFVDFGMAKDGFLPVEAARHFGGAPDGGERPDITSLVHEGQAVLVQVRADAVADKGARLESDISLAGHYAVYGPNRGGTAVSGKITDEAERNRLIDVFKSDDGGFVVRTAAEGKGDDELLAEAESLRARWAEIRDKVDQAEAPAEIEAELDPVLRSLRDAVSKDVSKLVVADRAAHSRAVSYAKLAFAGGGPAISPHSADGDLFEDYGIAEQIEELLRSRVALPGGGALTIEATEALTAVDVDTAGVRGPDRAANALAVNIEAAAEVARQVRLRGIGGLVVVDFVSLDDDGDKQQVAAAMKAALAKDPSPTRMGVMDDFGLIAFTRRRGSKGPAAAMLERCRACGGGGQRLSLASAAAQAYRTAELEARNGPPGPLAISVASDVANAMAEGAADIQAFADRVGREISIAADPQRARDSVEVWVEEIPSRPADIDFDGGEGNR